MTPNISHKSTFIFFIISINIVSVVCELKAPIHKDFSKGGERIFVYSNYKANSNEIVLDENKFYNSYYNLDYWMMPDPSNRQSFDEWKNSYNNFCENIYVSKTFYKHIYFTSQFGRMINELRACLKNYLQGTDFESFNRCCSPDHDTRKETTITCLGLTTLKLL